MKKQFCTVLYIAVTLSKSGKKNTYCTSRIYLPALVLVQTADEFDLPSQCMRLEKLKKKRKGGILENQVHFIFSHSVKRKTLIRTSRHMMTAFSHYKVHAIKCHTTVFYLHPEKMYKKNKNNCFKVILFHTALKRLLQVHRNTVDSQRISLKGHQRDCLCLVQLACFANMRTHSQGSTKPSTTLEYLH